MWSLAKMIWNDARRLAAIRLLVTGHFEYWMSFIISHQQTSSVIIRFLHIVAISIESYTIFIHKFQLDAWLAVWCEAIMGYALFLVLRIFDATKL